MKRHAGDQVPLHVATVLVLESAGVVLLAVAIGQSPGTG